MTKIGIIGLGFVGNAIRKTFEIDPHRFELVLVDNDPTKGCLGTYQQLKYCDGIFVCVPSPQRNDGSCDTSILEVVLENLSDYTGVIISKVTAPPQVYARLNNKYQNLVYSPEFLTAANAVDDYRQSTYAIIGGNVKAYRMEAERILKSSLPYVIGISHCSIKEASLTKYTINSFLATKVLFFNELYELASKTGIDFNNVVELVKLDERLGISHMQVPGPDGKFGFGGACFPKDTSALLKFAEENGINLNVLDSAVKKNIILRLTDSK